MRGVGCRVSGVRAGLANLLLGLLVSSCQSSLLSTPRLIPIASLAVNSKEASGAINTIVGTGVAGLGPDGKLATESPLYLPQDLTFGPDGLPYLIDWNNHRIRRISSNNTIETIAGTGELGDGPQGSAKTGRFNHPTHIAFDRQGKMIVSAWHNSRVSRVDVAADKLSFVCGTGARSFGGDDGPCNVARLDLPVAVVFDSKGHMFIADQANQRIRKMDTAGIITTVVGNGVAGYSGDGGLATKAQIRNPVGQAADPAGRIAIDSADNIYIADSGNHCIRKVTAGGVISTIAGTGKAGFSGDNGPATQAQFNGPRDVEVRPDGTLYIADTFNSCIRKVSIDGTITTVAGVCTKQGFAGDGEQATQALLDRPYGITIGPDDRLYIADTHNQRIRVVNP